MIRAPVVAGVFAAAFMEAAGAGGWVRAALLAAGLLLLGGAMGYAAGWWRGRQAGEQLSDAGRALRLREHALRAGRCPVCGTEARSPQLPAGGGPEGRGDPSHAATAAGGV